MTTNYTRKKVRIMHSNAKCELVKDMAALRMARNNVHQVLDPIWQQGHMERNKAYRWLAKRLSLPTSDCHVSSFDMITCNDAIAFCVKKLDKLTTSASISAEHEKHKKIIRSAIKRANDRVNARAP